MLYLDSIDDIEDAVNLDSNFEIWFDTLVSFNETKYWEVSPNNQSIINYFRIRRLQKGVFIYDLRSLRTTFAASAIRALS